MPVNINADTVVGGAVVTADASGVLALQAAGSTQVTVAASGVTLAQPLPVASGGTGSASGLNLATAATGTLPVANGGTGAASLTANNVLLGNGTSAVQVVAPGTSGNVLTSNGTTWTSAAGPVAGLTLLQTITASSSATVDLETGIGSTYDNYLIVFTGVAPATDNVILYARLKINGTYQSSAYSGVNFYGGTDDATIYKERSNNDVGFGIARYGVGNASGRTAQGQLWFGSPTSTSIYKSANWAVTAFNPVSYGTNVSSYNTGGGLYNGGAQALTGVRFLFGSGNIASGVFRLYGIRNS